MRVLIGCECSGIVRDAFATLGHEAWSCDLQPCERGGKNHLQMDVLDAISSRQWDFIGTHPDCTALTVSGNSTYAKGKQDYQKRLDSVKWTCELWKRQKAAATYAYLENPVGVLSTLGDMDEPSYHHPWQFGHGEVKKLGFRLYNLSPLKPTDIVEGREAKCWKMGPSPTRKADRSRTLEGVAKAMAEQWEGFHP